ncbi:MULTISPECIES: molybdopterin oxidoreductase family protein [Arthrobacter]|uniref:Molybdopterin oxidoreductase family protein n=2 Tax=Arthrobacter TaxID=1663 RepID=A0ABU9KN22_9MICC|nr:molybdopterin oxidoreductase family protein [Arthrobacter sp. YJM1]MDP5228254.1 molybdopterin oxidoreductase family protein [Arthrobacter sp. YJM1]
MTATHCPYCALQCAMTLTPSAGDTPVEIAGRDFPTNRGGLCRKGWTAAELLNHPERLSSPLIRGDDGALRPASWEEALERVASGIRTVQDRHGRDGVGVFGSGGLSNEKAYLLGKFARVALRTSRIDYNGRFCMSSAAAAGNRAFGLDRGLPFPLADLDTADTVLLLGSNVAETMPPFVQHLAGARAAGGLIVVDPRRSPTALLTEDGAGTHLAPAPKTDLILLLGLAHILVNRGWLDDSYLAARTSGVESVIRSVAAWWPERVQAATGVPADVLVRTARRLADSARTGSCYILTGRGVEQHSDGTDTATAAINLALLLGLPGSARGGYGTLTGQGNGQGGREHGQKSDQLPGYRKITDPAARAHLATVWGVREEEIPGPGVPAVELLSTLGLPGGVHALLVHGANPAVSAPDAAAVREGLDRLDLLVVCDFFPSETARQADVVLPVLQWAEEEGTMTNLEGRVLRRRRALRPPEGARSELWVLHRLAALLGVPGGFPTEPREAFEELRRASAGGLADYSGISYELLDSGAEVHWPYPAGGGGTPRLFRERFAHPDGRARLVAVRPAVIPDGAAALGRDEFHLATGRLLEHYQSGAQTRRVTALLEAQPEPRLQIHPASAARLGIMDGAPVRVRRSGTGPFAPRLLCRAEVTTFIRLDTVFAPFHFADGASANQVTEAVTDPVSGMPEFKTTRVRIEPVAASSEGVTG